jgi:hypothetical protein
VGAAYSRFHAKPLAMLITLDGRGIQQENGPDVSITTGLREDAAHYLQPTQLMWLADMYPNGSIDHLSDSIMTRNKARPERTRRYVVSFSFVCFHGGSSSVCTAAQHTRFLPPPQLPPLHLSSRQSTLSGALSPPLSTLFLSLPHLLLPTQVPQKGIPLAARTGLNLWSSAEWDL